MAKRKKRSWWREGVERRGKGSKPDGQGGRIDATWTKVGGGGRAGVLVELDCGGAGAGSISGVRLK